MGEGEREGVGEAFTLATEGVRASRVVAGWRCSSRVARWARWERRLGMRGKRTETQVLILYQYPLRASPWAYWASALTEAGFIGCPPR